MVVAARNWVNNGGRGNVGVRNASLGPSSRRERNHILSSPVDNSPDAAVATKKKQKANETGKLMRESLGTKIGEIY